MGLVLSASGEEVKMLLVAGVEAGGEAVPGGVANKQPPAGIARTIRDIMINAKYHLSLFIFALNGI
jgi:hypothetical protein